MLPAYWRLRVRNSTDQTLTYDNAARINAIVTPWTFASGAMAQGANISDDLGFDAGETIIATAESEGDVQNNTANLYIGFTGIFQVIADVSSTDGTVDLYMEVSPDNTNWPSDQADFDITTDCILLARLNMSTDAVDEGRACCIEF
jgi:hypothetical protein